MLQEAVALREEDLPLVLPDTDNFRPSGTPESPLAAIPQWVNTTDPRTGAAPDTPGIPQSLGLTPAGGKIMALCLQQLAQPETDTG